MKRLIPLLLTLAMLFSLFVGCGGTATSNAENPTTEESAAAVASTPEEPAPEPDAPEEVSLSEVEAIPEAKFDIYGPFSEEEIVLSYWKLWPPFLEGYDPMDASLFSTLYAATNVRVDVSTIGTDAASEQFNLMVASGDYLDIIENGVSNYSGGGVKGIEDEVFVNLRPYMETYAPDYWAVLQTDEVAQKNLIYADGSIASMCSLFDADPVTQSGLWIRTDWLKEQNLEKPSTLEDLENVLAVFRDEYGCTDAFACRENCNIPVGDVFGAYEWSVTPEGEVVYGYTDLRDEYKAYCNTSHKWYTEGFFSSSFATANDTNMPQVNMLVDGSSGLLSSDILLISELAVLDDTVEVEAVAPITKNADDMLPESWGSRMNGSNQAVISTNCQHIEEAVAYINYAFTDQCFMAANWGIEGETYTMENGEPVFTDKMLNNPNLAASFTPLAFISPGFPFLKSYEMALSTYNHPAQQGCYEIFASKIDPSLPKTGFPTDFISFTTEESEVIAQYQTDIETYVLECRAKFITGDMDVDAEYDAFADKLVEMGSDEIKAVYQAAYDRFLGK